MDQDTIIAALIGAHRDLQTMLGHPGTPITPDTCPLTQLPDFDSPAIPTTIRTVTRQLGLPPLTGAKSKNLYISADRRQKLTIREIAGRIAALGS